MLPRVDLICTDEFNYALMNSPDLIGNHIKKHGSWGRLEAGVCQYLVQGIQNAVVLDLGANLGGFTLPIARSLQQFSGTVHAFEPQRVVFQQLCANIFLNRLDNVYSHNKAVGPHCGSLRVPEINFAKSKSAGSVTLDRNISDQLAHDPSAGRLYEEIEGKEYLVDMVSLDSLKFSGPISFVKVDVEGFEAEVFRGAAQTLRNHQFPPVFYEVWKHEWYKEKADKTNQLLTDMGYKLTDLEGDTLAQHPQYPRQLGVAFQGAQVRLTKHGDWPTQ